MQCHHYDAGRCRSCTLLDLAYPTQVTGKQEHCAELLAPLAPDLAWLPTVGSAESGFRNKAKMVVTGTTDAPVLGILAEGGGVDLTDCPLYPPALQASFPAFAEFVTRARLVPYDVRSRRGELKYVLVTLSPTATSWRGSSCGPPSPCRGSASTCRPCSTLSRRCASCP